MARDYIERMANPVYGFATNEDYSLRFAQLLATEGFEESLRNEVEALHDPDELTSNGWLWLIGWARARQIELQEDLLVELFDEWSSVAARCLIVDLATYRYPELTLQRGDFSLVEFPNRFLRRIMVDAIGIGQEREPPSDQPRRERPEAFRLTARAESALIVFLQVGTPVTLAAAQALLRHRWVGHDQLFDFLREIADTLDAETRDIWSETLRIRLRRE